MFGRSVVASCGNDPFGFVQRTAAEFDAAILLLRVSRFLLLGAWASRIIVGCLPINNDG